MEMEEALDEDFPAPTRDPMQFTKTYSRLSNKCFREEKQSKENYIEGLSSKFTKKEAEPLSTLNAVTFLLNGTLNNRVCRYCLNVTSDLTELDEVFQVASNGSLYKIALKDMVASFHPFKVAKDPNLPNKICNECTDRTVSSYLFAQQCERSERALRNCLEDMYEQVNKLDSLDGQKKRGRQKLNPNYNKLHTENKNVIDYAEPLYHLINTSIIEKTNEVLAEFECHKCFEVLPDMISLLNHNKSHPKTMWFNCRFCGQSFPKIHQLKRHFRVGHAPNQIDEKPFMCGKCGINFDSYNKYLEHKEKHKFKSVMEHILEKKMDRLCAVCLNQDGNMSSLNDIVCLHGGCKEMSGDKSLLSILASTLPEKKNKYQELLLPKRASIVRFIDKKLNTKFVFPKPDILTTEDTEPESYNYLFFFCDPKTNKIDEILENNEISEMKKKHNDTKRQKLAKVEIDEINFANDNHSKDSPTNYTDLLELDTKERNEINESEKEKMKDTLIDSIDNFNADDENAQHQNIKHDMEEVDQDIVENELQFPNKIEFVFSKPNYAIDDRKLTKNVDYIDNEKLFYNRTFNNVDKLYTNVREHIKDNFSLTKETKIDKENNWIFNKTSKNDDIAHKKDIKDLKKPCNVCWVFKHLDKCDFCKKPNTTETEAPKITTDDSKYNDIAKGWRCKVCFTNNKENRQICQCCENDCTLKLEKLFNFNKINCDFEQKTDIQPSEDFSYDNIIEMAEDKKDYNHVNVFTEINRNTNILLTEINNENDLPNPIMDIQHFMETEYQHFNDSQLCIESQAMDMDVEENEPQTFSIELNTEKHEMLATGTKMKYQFAIGTGEKGPKKKRPYRNVSRAFHK